MKSHITLANKVGQEKTLETKDITWRQFAIPFIDILLKGFPEKAFITGILTLMGWVPGIFYNHMQTKKYTRHQLEMVVDQGFYAKNEEDKELLLKLLK